MLPVNQVDTNNSPNHLTSPLPETPKFHYKQVFKGPDIFVRVIAILNKVPDAETFDIAKTDLNGAIELQRVWEGVPDEIKQLIIESDTPQNAINLIMGNRP